MIKIMQVFTIFLISLYHCITCYSIETWMSNLPSTLGACSEYFQYQRIDGFVNGKLQLPSIKMGDTVRMTFLRSDFPRQSRFNGIFLPDEGSQTVINKIQNAQSITYRVDFPITNGVPILINIFINDTELCRGNYNRSADVPVLELQHTMRLINGSLPVFTYNINIPHFKNPINTTHTAASSTCGVIDTEIFNSAVRPLVYGGSDINRGEYPWLTAIYRNRTTELYFLCGGSLVTSKIILTAAHCFQGSVQSPENIVVTLGRHNLSNYMEDSAVIRQIEALILHPEYKPGRGFSDADLALLEMKQLVSFTKFIKPICLWSKPGDSFLAVNHVGIVVGWGSNERGNTLSEVPKQVKMNIVSEVECLRSTPTHTTLTSSRTFCAGNSDSSGPCEGDSGGGFMVNRYGQWILRGVISAGLTLEGRCNLRKYTVYCDVAKHRSWIEKYVEKQKFFENICGISGTESCSEHPWFAAVYLKMFTGEMYLDTGVLISARSILTRGSGFLLIGDQRITPDKVRIYLGRYDLNNIQENDVQTRDAATLIFHPEFQRYRDFVENNLLIIQMKTSVSFTEYVKPICLWSARTDKMSQVQSATISSWDINGVFAETFTVPTSIKIEKTSIQQCERPLHSESVVDRLLCIRRLENQTGGMLMLKSNERWSLRGLNFVVYDYHRFIVSNTTEDYFVYSDIAKYVLWIDRNKAN